MHKKNSAVRENKENIHLKRTKKKMKAKKVILCMLLASIIPASSIMVANDDVPDEEKEIA